MTKAFPELLALRGKARASAWTGWARSLLAVSTEKTATSVRLGKGGARFNQAPRPRSVGARDTAAVGPALTPGATGQNAHPTLQADDTVRNARRASCALSPSRPRPFICKPSRLLAASCHEMEVLRCWLCGKTFTAPLAARGGKEKYDPSVGVMMGMLRYGSRHALLPSGTMARESGGSFARLDPMGISRSVARQSSRWSTSWRWRPPRLRPSSMTTPPCGWAN